MTADGPYCDNKKETTMLKEREKKSYYSCGVGLIRPLLRMHPSLIFPEPPFLILVFISPSHGLSCSTPPFGSGVMFIFGGVISSPSADDYRGRHRHIYIYKHLLCSALQLSTAVSDVRGQCSNLF